MEDVYLEYLIKRKKDGKQIAATVGIITAAAVVSFLLIILMMAMAAATFNPETGSPYGSFIFSVGLILVALACYGAYLVINMFNIEFEYILTNSALDIDKVLAKKGRKPFVSLDFKDIIICAAVDDNEHNGEYKSVTPDKVYDAVGDKDNGNIYFVDFTSEGQRKRVLFQPTKKMIESAWKFNPRNVFVKNNR